MAKHMHKIAKSCALSHMINMFKENPIITILGLAHISIHHPMQKAQLGGRFYDDDIKDWSNSPILPIYKCKHLCLCICSYDSAFKYLNSFT